MIFMKNSVIKVIFLLATVMTLSAQLSAQEQSRRDSLDLARMFSTKTEQWKEAYNSGDATNLIPLYTPDARYISSHVPGLVADGRNRVTEYFQAGIDLGGHIDLIEIIRMDVSCDLATLLCKYQATNSGVTVTGRNLLILKKVGEVWLIVLHMTVV
jgi:ketosteroid isomerase-like protein